MAGGRCSGLSWEVTAGVVRKNARRWWTGAGGLMRSSCSGVPRRQGGAAVQGGLSIGRLGSGGVSGGAGPSPLESVGAPGSLRCAQLESGDVQGALPASPGESGGVSGGNPAGPRRAESSSLHSGVCRLWREERRRRRRHKSCIWAALLLDRSGRVLVVCGGHGSSPWSSRPRLQKTPYRRLGV